jgi:prefoldin subunit 5
MKRKVEDISYDIGNLEDNLEKLMERIGTLEDVFANFKEKLNNL